MKYTIQNEHMKAQIEDAGAQLVSLCLDGHEYLWQGDPAFWRDHAPVLFPFVGRLYNKTYSVNGRDYEMRIHGIAKYCTFSVSEQKEDSITLVLTDSEETLKVYPFRFRFAVTYRLAGSTLCIRDEVTNRSDSMMYFGLGGHPGFNAPLDENGTFEDCYLEFSEKSTPSRVIFSDSVLLVGKTEPYPLEDGRIIRLHHDLFDHDAVVLQDMPWQVSLKSRCSRRSVTVSYPGMPWVGFWHAVKKPAPYVCIEPWVTLPGREGVHENFAAMSDLIRLQAGGVYENNWSIALQ